VLEALSRRPGEAAAILDRLRTAASTIATGAEKLNRIRSLAMYLQRQPIALGASLNGAFGTLIASEAFPPSQIVAKPTAISDPSAQRRNRWNQGGLHQHGP